MNRTPGLSTSSVGSDYSDEERAFLMAVDAYKRERQRPFPTWREVLAVVRSLGYRKVSPAGPLPTLREAAGPEAPS